jgi:hypothetical protein
MFKKSILLFSTVLWLTHTNAQKKSALDSLADYDALFNELESFLDSLTAPRSFTVINVGVSKGQFQYQTSRTTLKEVTQSLFTPSAGYYHKSGFGVNAITSIIHNGKPTVYQTAATASYDYVKNRNFLTGISLTHYLTKDSLPFYTSPLSNEVAAYFSYRDWWLKPTLAAAYGWGSVTNVVERREKIKLLKRRQLVTTTTETTESIADFTVTASVKHDFYWLNVLSKRDYFRVTPQLVFTGGTQKYGLAQTNNSYVSAKETGTTILYHAENNHVAARSRFQPLSFSARLRTGFSKGPFFIQPQLILDYYFPEEAKKIVPFFVTNAGILF